MNDYKIITDSCCDLPDDYCKENDICVLPMQFTLDGKDYYNYSDHREIGIVDFYNHLRNGSMSKTAQINSQRFYELFVELYEKGVGILVLAFSSALSGTYNSARIAKEQLLEEHPDAKVEVIDSLCASMGEGLLVHYASEAKKKGMSLTENAQYCLGLRQQISHWFTVDDIDTLRRGGRVSASAAFIAKTLSIKPVLYVSPEGKLIPRMKKLGRKAALNSLVDKMLSIYEKDKNEVVFISHGDALEDALYVKKAIEEKTGLKNFLINEIGPVVGSHSGPGTVALFFLGKPRE